MNNINENLKMACQDARTMFIKLDEKEYADIISKLEFVIGSYEFDHNPVGLHEFAAKAAELFKEYRKRYPRKLTRKFIDSIEKTIKEYETAC
jgi:hypothetical protein